MNNERIRSDSTMQHLARQNWNSWYSMSSNLRSVFQTLRSPSVPVRAVGRLSWDSTSAKHVPQVSWDSRVRPNHVVTGTEHFPYNTCPKADQNCAGLMRAERHVTRRDVVSSQTEGNSVSVVEAVHRDDRFSHKIVQVHQQGKTP